MNEFILEAASIIFYTILTLGVYRTCARLQKVSGKAWLNPMLLSIFILMVILYIFSINFELYYASTKLLGSLLEPAVVAFGYPLYLHIKTIKKHWHHILWILSLGVIIAICTSFLVTIYSIQHYAIAVSISLKSVTTPIGIALTEQMNGNSSITALAIILAGLLGALLGPKWLNFIGVDSPKAQGLAIGAGSHALGTATLSKLSYEHAAFSSLSLIVSAILTAIFSPTLIQLMNS